MRTLQGQNEAMFSSFIGLSPARTLVCSRCQLVGSSVKNSERKIRGEVQGRRGGNLLFRLRPLTALHVNPVFHAAPQLTECLEQATCTATLLAQNRKTQQGV